MPYTNVWVTNHPPGATTPAKDIDAAIQRLRLDIDERLASILVSTTADPVALKPELIGTKVGKWLVVPHSALVGVNTYITDGTAEVLGSSGPAYLPIILPAGVTIKEIQFTVNRNIAANVAITMRRRIADGSTAEATFGATDIVTTTAGVHMVTTLTVDPALAHVVDAAYQYYARLDYGGSGAGYFHAMRIRYDTPDSRNTY